MPQPHSSRVSPLPAILNFAILIAAVLPVAMADSAAVGNFMAFDEAWPILQEEVINKLIHNLELGSPPESQCFSSDDYMRFYTLVYNVSCPNALSPEVEKLYDHYKRTFEDYISSKASIALFEGKRERKSIERAIEKMEQSQNYDKLALKVYGEIKDQVRDAIVTLIDRERNAEQIDHAMVKQVLNIYEEISEDKLKHYAEDIEEAIVEATATFYSRKALEWIANKSYEDYMPKVEECLEQEQTRVSDYLKIRSKGRVIEVVQHELLIVHASKLEEKKQPHMAVA